MNAIVAPESHSQGPIRKKTHYSSTFNSLKPNNQPPLFSPWEPEQGYHHRTSSKFQASMYKSQSRNKQVYPVPTILSKWSLGGLVSIFLKATNRFLRTKLLHQGRKCFWVNPSREVHSLSWKNLKRGKLHLHEESSAQVLFKTFSC